MALWLNHLACKLGFTGLILAFSSPLEETINRGPMIIFQDKLLTRTYFYEVGDYVAPNV